MALEIAFDDKKHIRNASFLHEPVKQNNVCALLMKGFFCNEYTKNMSVVLSSTDDLDFKVSHSLQKVVSMHILSILVYLHSAFVHQELLSIQFCKRNCITHY